MSHVSPYAWTLLRADFGCLSLCFETHDGIVMDSWGVEGSTLFAR